MEDGTEFLSHTQIRTLLECGSRYKYKYVERIREPLGVDAVVGFAVHDALCNALQQQMDGLPVDRITETDVVNDALRRFPEKRASVAESKGGLKPDHKDRSDEELLGVVERCTRAAWEWWVEQGMTPLAVEVEATRRRGGIAKVGYLDVYAKTRDGKYVVLDWKTAAAKKKVATRDHSLQVLGYAAELRDKQGPVDEAAVVYITKTKTPAVCYCPVPVTEGSIAWHDGVLDIAERMIRGGELLPTGMTSWICDPKWCGYWGRCPQAARHEQEAEA